MTSNLRRRTIGAFIAMSGLLSILVSPASAEVLPTESTSSASAAGTGSEPHVPAPTNYSGLNVIDFANHDGGHLQLTSDLINSGTIYAISTNPAITTAIFSAPNIFNQTGATISSVLPTGGLPGYANAISGLSLVFNATNNFTNAGLINSAGALAINAGGSITNALPQGVIAPPPVMQAMTNIDIASQIGNIVNAGTIASVAGNINLTAAASNVLSVNNIGGIISALQGNINVRDALYTGTAQMNIAGGDWLAKNLNLMNGQGAISAQLGSVTGVLNAYGNGANIGVWTGDLTLGVLKADGDPTYYSALGDVDLTLHTPINTNGEDLAIIAGGNITTAGDLIINTSSGIAGVAAGNVLMVAGARFIIPVKGDELPAGPLVTVQFTSPDPSVYAGGSIIPGGALQIDASGNLNQAGAGNVTLVAYSGTDPNSGQIRPVDTSNSYVRALNYSGHSGGSVTMIAGAVSGDAINFGNVNGGGGGASVSIYSANPVISGSGNMTVINGTVMPGSGSFIPGALNVANVTLGDVNNDGADGLDSTFLSIAENGASGGHVELSSGGSLFVNSLSARGGKGGSDQAFSYAADGGAGGVLTVQGDTVQINLLDIGGGKGGDGASGGFATWAGSGGAAGSFTGTAGTSLMLGNGKAVGGDGGNGGTGNFISGIIRQNPGGAGGSFVLSSADIAIGDIEISGGMGGSGPSVAMGNGGGGSAYGGGAGGSFTATATQTFQQSGSLIARGGKAGSAGTSPIHDGSVLEPGGKGGTINITAGTDVAVGMLDTTGGDGGSVPSLVLIPGSPSNGGDGGSITINAGTSLQSFDSFYANGGHGATGEGTTSSFSAGTTGSNGGNGGVITLNGAACCLGDLYANGGDGGQGGNSVGIGTFGGLGGNSGTGGSVIVNGSQGISVGNIYANAGRLGEAGTGDLGTFGPGSGANGGTITLASPSADPMLGGLVVFGEIGATGVGDGFKGGTVSLSSGLAILTNSDEISALGSEGADGGTINLTAPALAIFGTDSDSGRSLDVSSTKGNGGTINVLTTGPDPLSNGCGCNSIFGNIAANGFKNGGKINLAATGGFSWESGILISANGATGNGGLIQFSSPGSSTLNFRSSAVMSAVSFVSDSGRIGFNAGPTGAVNIEGDFGTLSAGEYVGIGNLDPTTLDVINPLEVQLSEFPIFNYSMVQGSVGNKIFVSRGVPPTPGGSTPTTLTGGVSQEVVLPPTTIPQIPSNSTITNIDQTPFIVSLAEPTYVTTDSGANIFIDGVLVTNPADALGAKGLTISQGNDGNLILGKGNMLLMPPISAGPMQVQTQEGTLTVAPGAMAFLIETGNDVAVYALHEKQSGDVIFKSGKNTLDLATGQEAVFSKKTNEFFSKVNPGALIPARQVNEYKLDNGVKAYVAEYSMPMALSIIRPLKNMRQSDKADLRKVVGTVQKNAAILSIIGTRFGPYKGSGAP